MQNSWLLNVGILYTDPCIEAVIRNGIFFFFFVITGEGYFVKGKLSWQILSSSFRSRVVIGSSHWHNGWAFWKEVVAWEFFLWRITYHETRQGETEPLSEWEEDRADFHLLTRCHTWISTFSQPQNWETAQNLCCDFPKPVPGTQSRVYALACTNINWVHWFWSITDTKTEKSFAYCFINRKEDRKKVFFIN